MAIQFKNNVDKYKKIVVLSTSSGNQISSTYDKKGHRLFTYFILTGLKGNTDENVDGKVDTAELFNDIRLNVTRIARKLYNNEQIAQFVQPNGKKIVLMEGL